MRGNAASELAVENATRIGSRIDDISGTTRLPMTSPPNAAMTSHNTASAK